MILRLGLALVTLTSSALASSASSPQAPAAQPPVVAGQVINGLTGEPIPDAVVRLVYDARGFDRTTTTDQKGAFAFGDAPAGTAHVRASRFGFFDGAWGQERYRGADRPAVIGAGVALPSFVVRLWPPGTLRGVVRQAGGQPIASATVALLRRPPDTWDDDYQPAAGAAGLTTDRAGRFQFLQLEPDDYVVVVPGSAGATREAFGTTFYPNAVELAHAVPVKVGVGETVDNIEVSVEPVLAADVFGQVVGPTGPAAQVDVKLYRSEYASNSVGFLIASTRTDGEGRFRLRYVPSGSYVVESVVYGPGPPEGLQLWGQAPVLVNGQDVTGVSMTLERTYNMTGRVEFSGAAGPAAAPRSPVRVVLRPLSIQVVPIPGDRFREPGAAADPAGVFTITGVLPGEYLVTVEGLPAGWYLKSAVAGGQDLADRALTIGPSGETTVRVTLSDRPAVVHGTVGAPDGRIDSDTWVLLFSTDQTLWNRVRRRVKSTKVGTSGQFSFADVPPGDYYLACLVGDDFGTVRPRLLESVIGSTMRVQVAEGDVRELNLRIR